MKIDGIISIFFIYLLGDLFGFIVGLTNGGFSVNGKFFTINAFTFFIALFVQTTLLYLLLVIYIKTPRFQISRNFGEKIGSSVFGYLVIAIQVVYLYFSLSYGAGLAGDDVAIGYFGYFGILFAVVQPDILYVISAPFLLSKKVFWISTLVFTSSLASRGWMGGFMIAAFIIIIRFSPIYLTKQTLKVFVISIFGALTLLPIMSAMKWGFRSKLSLDEIIYLGIENYNTDTYISVLEETVGRFSHINYVALLINESQLYSRAFENSEFRSFWENSIIYTVVCRAFASCKIDLNSIIGQYSLGLSSDKWNVDPGLAGWFFVVGLYLPIYIAFVIFITVYCFKKIGQSYGSTGISIVSLFSFIYLYHGWINPYLNIIIYMTAISFFLKLKLK